MLFYFTNTPIMKKTLSSADRRTLKQAAHHLKPVVMIGRHGLTQAVVQETEVALQAHELIKIRIADDVPEERKKMALALAEQLDACVVDYIGKLLIMWRKKEDKE